MDRYETVKLLGQGGEGSALLVKRKEDQQLFVCKKKTYISIDEANQGLQEAISLARFSSEFVTRYEDLFLHIRHEDGLSIYDLNLVMEFCSGGSIWDRLLGAREHSTSQESSSELELIPLVLVEKWIVELCKGLKAVHQLKVMHRDLKSENIFLTAHEDVKIGDFGLATSSKTSKQDHSGTYHYMAPEVHRKQLHNTKADIWSLACIVFEVSTSHVLPLDDIDFNHIIDQGGAERLHDTLVKYFPRDRLHILKLVQYMMVIDPLQRPNIDQILEHEFFRQYTLQSEKAKALKQQTFDKLADSVKDGLSRQLNKRDVDATLDLLARELRDEPRMTFLFTKDAEKRQKLVRNVVLNYLVKYCAKKGNNLWGRYSPSGQLQAAALWFPPDRSLRPSFAQIIRVGMQNFGKIGPKTGMKIHQFAEFFEKTYQHDLPDNCWVLSYLAVDKELQSKGIGRHLLSHVFTVADYHGQDCATLCFDGQGLDFFLKVGFTLYKTITEPIKKTACPPAQILIRRARSDIDHSLSSLSLSQSSSERDVHSSHSKDKHDKKRSSKQIL